MPLSHTHHIHFRETGDTMTIQESYTDHVIALRDLGKVLAYANEVRYEAPPSGAAQGGGLVSNPTLDVVLDPRRWQLSEEVDAVETTLRHATASVTSKTEALRRAVERWEGQRGE